MFARFTGLWRHRDFMKLWAGQTISVFGSLVGGTTLPFTAILVLHATPLEMGLLAAAGLAPGFAAGLFAGVWVDRLRRRPILIVADLGRALLLATIPLAAFLHRLQITQLYSVAFLNSILLLIAQQLLGDGCYTIYDINTLSVRQMLAPERLLGRVNASMQFISQGALLMGSLLGGVLGTAIGLRSTLVLAACAGLLGAVWLLLSPVRGANILTEIPATTVPAALP